MLNILTIDLEDWYHSSLELFDEGRRGDAVPPTKRVISNTLKLLDILKENETKATFFILGTVAEKFPELIREIKKRGHEIGSHGYAHKLIYKQTPQEFLSDLQKSVELIERIVGEKVIGYRAPYFSVTQESYWALDILQEQGLKYDSSIVPVKTKFGGFADFSSYPTYLQDKKIFEYPISTTKLWEKIIPIGGGGYLRILPYRLIRKGLRKINNRGKPNVIYLHPYELDREELRSSLPKESHREKFVRFTQNINRRRMEGKIRALLRDFRFAPVRDLLPTLG